MSNKNSYSQILSSSSIMGGVAGIAIILGMVRTKFAAILIGTIGVGLSANFIAIQNLIGTIAGLGIEQSAVRDVATAVGQNNLKAIGYTVLTLRRMCWITGLLGAVTTILLSPLLSQLTFDSKKYVLDIAALGLVILFINLKSGQIAMIQGMRRIGDIAKIQIIGAITGTLITIIFYFWLGIRGIVPALVLTAAIGLAISWLFARKVDVPKVVMTWKESILNAGSIVKLGIAMMWSGLLGSIVIYATNMLITQQINIQAVGIYSAAFALSGMFVNFVLNAMGTDYLPRLSGAIHDKEAVTRLVNEQTEIGLLIALPGLLATISLAPWVIKVFYANEFLAAADLLQWFILGCLGRVIGFPMGYMFVALGKTGIFFFTQTLFNLVHITLIIIGLFSFGLVGTAIAFACMYVIGVNVNLIIARKINGYTWDVNTKKLILICLCFVVLTFIAVRSMSIWPATTLGIAVTMAATIFCLKELVKRLGNEHRVIRVAFKIPGIRLVCGYQRMN